MMTQSKPIFNSVLLLTGTLILVKILSAIYRIPYQNVLGDEGLYAYQQVYPVIAIVGVVSLHALPSVMSGWMSSSDKTSVYAMFWWLQVLCFIVSGSIFVLSDEISSAMGDEQLSMMLRLASLTLLPLVLTSMIRGYYQMKHQMTVIAVSQLIDQVIRVSIILVAIVIFYLRGISIYEAGSIAILGSVIACLFVCGYLFFKKRPPLQISWEIKAKDIQNVITMTFLYAISYLILIFWQLIDSFTVIHLLQQTGLTFEESIKAKGIFDRGASLVQMGLIITTTFSFVLIPLLTDALRKKNLQRVHEYANTSLKITLLFSMAAAVGLINLLPLLNTVFFKTNMQVATLSVFMLAVIFVTCIIMYTALLQAKSKKKVLFTGLIIGLITKLIGNIIFVLKFGILGVSIATIISLSVYTLILHLSVYKAYHLKNMNKFILKVAFVLFIMSVVIQIILSIPSHTRLTSLLILLIASAVGALIVLIGTVKLKILNKEEWQHLPLMDKIIKE